MTGRLVDMAFTLGGKQRVTLEINGDFREIWDKLHQEPVLDVEIKKHREKRSLSANAYFHVLCNKISAETGESEDAVKRRLVVSYGALARDKDGKPVGLKLPPTVDPSDFYPYVRLYETRQENGKDYSCYFVYKESHKIEFMVDNIYFAGPKQDNQQGTVDDGGTNPPPATYRNQQPQPQQMGFATQSQRQQWQGAADHPGNVQVSQSFSQGSDDDFSVLDDADDLPF